jgi:hypothetical protein
MPVQTCYAVGCERGRDACIEISRELLGRCRARGLDARVGDLLAFEEVGPAGRDRAQPAGRSPEQTRFMRVTPCSPTSA